MLAPDRGGEPTDFVERPQVGGIERRPAAAVANLLHNLLTSCAITAVNQNLGAARSELTRGRATDPVGRSRNQDGLVAEVGHRLCILLTMPWSSARAEPDGAVVARDEVGQEPNPNGAVASSVGQTDPLVGGSRGLGRRWKPFGGQFRAFSWPIALNRPQTLVGLRWGLGGKSHPEHRDAEVAHEVRP